MQSKVVIEGGKIRMEAVDGQGEQCRAKHKPYLDAMGLTEGQVQEEVHPEMTQTVSPEQERLSE